MKRAAGFPSDEGKRPSLYSALCSLLALLPTPHLRKSPKALFLLSLTGHGKARSQHTKAKSSSALSCFLNRYPWPTRALIPLSGLLWAPAAGAPGAPAGTFLSRVGQLVPPSFARGRVNVAVWGGHLSRGSPDRAGVRSAAIYDRALLPGHEGRVFPGPLWAADGFGGASVSRVVPPSLPPGPLGEALSGGRGAFLVGGLAEGGGLLGVDDGHREAGLSWKIFPRRNPYEVLSLWKPGRSCLGRLGGDWGEPDPPLHSPGRPPAGLRQALRPLWTPLH